jgi:hypothetical protein
MHHDDDVGTKKVVSCSPVDHALRIQFPDPWLRPASEFERYGVTEEADVLGRH